MNCFLRLLALLMLLSWNSAANAHFIWMDVNSKGETPVASAYFGEAAEPGEPHLIGKILHTKAWARDAAGKATELKLAKSAEGQPPALSAECGSGPSSVEAFCDYGVYSHGGPGVLVQYYAKHLQGDWAGKDALVKSEKLALDVVPAIDGKQLSLTVLYNGKPAAEKEVVVVDPSEKQHDLTSDATGKVSVLAFAGRYAIRAAHIEPDKSGERDGKKYLQTWHYATVTFDVPTSLADAAAAPKKVEADPNAVAALKRARDGRAIWEKFPGFSSDLEVFAGGKELRGKVSFDSNGTTTLDFPESEITTWLEEQLASLVQHRMPDGEVTDGAITWGEPENSDHPLGRLIDLGDPNLKSAYRLKDDVIYEVNRTAGPNLHFTISVLEIERNAENKYLPRSFAMNFFDNKSGEVKTSLAFLNEWQRVGKFDLPRVVVEITSKGGKSETRRIEFSNCKLLN